MRVAVNISAVQFHQPGLVECMCRALHEAQLDPRCLEIELTESCVMSNPEESIAILEELSRMGVLISVDDFGTGYSSMSYLRRFPIDKLKIDKTFVAGMAMRIGRCLHRAGHRVAGAWPAAEGGGRRRGDRGAARDAEGHGLRPVPGLPLQPGGAVQRTRTVAARADRNPAAVTVVPALEETYGKLADVRRRRS